MGGAVFLVSLWMLVAECEFCELRPAPEDDNLRKISVGMSEEEVLAILGPPFRTWERFPEGEPYSGCDSYIYGECNDVHISYVMYRRGHVVWFSDGHRWVCVIEKCGARGRLRSLARLGRSGIF